MTDNIWDELEKDPEFRESMQRALADFKAGRKYHFNTKTGETTPAVTWSSDDPQQPAGWHHDGERWVRDPAP